MRRGRDLLSTILIGSLATATMDVGGVVGRKLGMVTSESIGIGQLGRWIASMARGRFVHEDLASEPALPRERPLGVLAHYLIGITLTGGYLALLRRRQADPRIATALAYGSATSVLPWLIVYPAYGLGWFGLRARPPGVLLRTSIVGHALFGLGIGLGAVIIAPRPRPSAVGLQVHESSNQSAW
jgi:hypothetical protein